jgi:crossover junction endodeoxyribonuclease RuvC
MIIGIDPGVKGGMALLWDKGNVEGVINFTGKTEDQIARELEGWLKAMWPYTPVAYLEKVGSMPGEGHMGAFTFGRVYGFLRGLCMGKGIRVKDVYPAVWQARLGCITKGNKNISKDAAIRLFPIHHKKQKITHATADSLLIAEYGRMMEGGALRGF